MDVSVDPAQSSDRQLVRQLADRARAEGLKLTYAPHTPPDRVATAAFSAENATHPRLEERLADLFEGRGAGRFSSCRGAGAELVDQSVAEREVGSGQGDEGSYQVSLGDPTAKQPADVQGELVKVSGGVRLEQHGELAG
jgi:hypothetical protein